MNSDTETLVTDAPDNRARGWQRVSRSETDGGRPAALPCDPAANNAVNEYTTVCGTAVSHDDAGNLTTCFYYDDQRVIYEAETRPEGLEERVFVYGNYIDEVLVMRRKAAGTGGWNQYFYGHDHLYSPTVLFQWYGMVLERYEYDAYGKVHVMDAGYNSRSESAFRNPVAFTGRTLDRLNGGSLEIMYYRARYYDPETGRFMQRDPLESLGKS